MDEAMLDVVTKAVKEAGIELAPDGEDGGGWDGGVVWLVPTDRPITEWKPIATRDLGS